jgi:hypothetical protein
VITTDIYARASPATIHPKRTRPKDRTLRYHDTCNTIPLKECSSLYKQ